MGYYEVMTETSVRQKTELFCYIIVFIKKLLPPESKPNILIKVSSSPAKCALADMMSRPALVHPTSARSTTATTGF